MIRGACRRIYLALSTLIAGLLPIAASADPQAFTVEVLDTRIWSEPRINDLKIAELSGLAYDPDTSRLYAVSDRSRLFVLDLDVTGDRLTTLEPLEGHRLTGPDGVRMRDLGFNPEGITQVEGDRLTIVSEAGPRIARFSLTGEWIEDLDVPAAVQDPTQQRGKNDGLEAIGRHPTLGLVMAPEQPLATEPRKIHTIYSSDGRRLTFDSADIGSTNIKSLEVMSDGRLLILERDKTKDDRLLTFLRVLDPATCPVQGSCATHLARIEVPGIFDADFEGLTHISEDLYLIVSDDKIGKDERSVFALLRVAIPARP